MNFEISGISSIKSIHEKTLKKLGEKPKDCWREPSLFNSLGPITQIRLFFSISSSSRERVSLRTPVSLFKRTIYFAFDFLIARLLAAANPLLVLFLIILI